MRVVVVGCGAVTREYQAPALLEVQKLGFAEVVGLIDRNADALGQCSKIFPAAWTGTSFDEMPVADLALVATPAGTHKALSTDLLARGLHLLVEKPIATSLEDARAIETAAARAGRVLAVGHFRRFFPAIESIRTLIASGVLGRPKHVSAEEGGLFRWPAASDSFFRPSEAGGGVTLDIGIHTLEILISWFGAPKVESYFDDALGGVEINSQARLSWQGGLAGEIKLSWDIPLANRYHIQFEKGSVTWRCGQATELLLDIDGVAYMQSCQSFQRSTRGSGVGIAAHGYLASFTAQWLDLISAIKEKRAPRVGMETAAAALATVREMYQQRQLLPQVALDPVELERAEALRQVNL